MAVALWNGRDPILKERLFGLTNGQGNHGEDVKEQYYYLDATPSHAYLKMLYKYPQRAFPYDELIEENRRRDRQQPEFELLDTNIFDDDRYFIFTTLNQGFWGGAASNLVVNALLGAHALGVSHDVKVSKDTVIAKFADIVDSRYDYTVMALSLKPLINRTNGNDLIFFLVYPEAYKKTSNRI